MPTEADSNLCPHLRDSKNTVLLRAGASCPTAAQGLGQAPVLSQRERQRVAKTASEQC